MLPVELHQPLLGPAENLVAALDEAAGGRQATVPDDVALLRDRVWQHVGVYAYTRAALTRWIKLPAHPLERIERLEQLRPLAAGMAIGVALIPGPLRRGIDSEVDLARANSEWTIFSGEPA